MLTSQREDAVVYQGDGEKFTRRLSKVIHGGQVVLSEIAWASIQDQIPGQSQVDLAIFVFSMSPTFKLNMCRPLLAVWHRLHWQVVLVHRVASRQTCLLFPRHLQQHNTA